MEKKIDPASHEINSIPVLDPVKTVAPQQSTAQAADPSANFTAPTKSPFTANKSFTSAYEKVSEPDPVADESVVNMPKKQFIETIVLIVLVVAAIAGAGGYFYGKGNPDTAAPTTNKAGSAAAQTSGTVSPSQSVTTTTKVTTPSGTTKTKTVVPTTTVDAGPTGTELSFTGTAFDPATLSAAKNDVITITNNSSQNIFVLADFNTVNQFLRIDADGRKGLGAGDTALVSFISPGKHQVQVYDCQNTTCVNSGGNNLATVVVTVK